MKETHNLILSKKAQDIETVTNTVSKYSPSRFLYWLISVCDMYSVNDLKRGRDSSQDFSLAISIDFIINGKDKSFDFSQPVKVRINDHRDKLMDIVIFHFSEDGTFVGGQGKGNLQKAIQILQAINYIRNFKLNRLVLSYKEVDRSKAIEQLKGYTPEQFLDWLESLYNEYKKNTRLVNYLILGDLIAIKINSDLNLHLIERVDVEYCRHSQKINARLFFYFHTIGKMLSGSRCKKAAEIILKALNK